MSLRERAYREAMRTNIEDVATRLQEVLGQKITAYAVGVKDPRSIGRYARGGQEPRDNVNTRLRQLHAITQVLLTRETPETVRAWMLGSNPLLEDRAPVELLHDEDGAPVAQIASSDAGEGYLSVVNAAEDFVRGA